MKKEYSLKSNIEFNKILNKGYKIRNKNMLVSVVKKSDFKIGISIPKKLGNAVFRNKNKRIIKNIIPNLNIYDSKVHVVLVARSSFIKLSFEDKYKELTNIFNKINEKK